MNKQDTELFLLEFLVESVNIEGMDKHAFIVKVIFLQIFFRQIFETFAYNI